MRQSITFGRIAGIPIGASWTWLPVFVLVVWTGAADFFPHWNPGLSTGAYVAMAVVEAVLFFVALLLHELGHALRARREGLRVNGITLWLFGGAARFTGEFPNPGVELRVALAGPFVTFVIGGASLLAAWQLSLPSTVDGVVFWLGVPCMVLLAFNLIPAYPLDGGRILHALLWAWRHDRRRATQVSTAVGRGFGYLLIGGGILLILDTGRAEGLWLGMGLVLARRREWRIAQRDGARRAAGPDRGRRDRARSDLRPPHPDPGRVLRGDRVAAAAYDIPRLRR